MVEQAERPAHAGPDDEDAWARDFFQRLLAQRLGAPEFDAAVQARWDSGRFIGRAPGCAAWLKSLALRQNADAGYGHDAAVRFRSHWLVGMQGHPGAIHIQAPPEQRQSASLLHKNRQPHRHDGARISLITQGEAILHLLRPDASGRPQRLDCPVREGDLILWPAWVTHTFDALKGFWLISAMSNYVAPSADGFSTAPDPSLPSLDALPPVSYRQHLSALDQVPVP